MKGIKIGDVFEIETPKGNGYFQYVYSNKEIAELIRVLPGLYTKLPDLASLVTGKTNFFVHFPLKAAIRQGIVKPVGNYDLPKGLKLPERMRTDFVDRDGRRKHWHIVDYETWQRKTVETLSPEHVQLSPWGVWNDTLLVERLAEGWTLEKWV